MASLPNCPASATCGHEVGFALQFEDSKANKNTTGHQPFSQAFSFITGVAILLLSDHLSKRYLKKSNDIQIYYKMDIATKKGYI